MKIHCSNALVDLSVHNVMRVDDNRPEEVKVNIWTIKRDGGEMAYPEVGWAVGMGEMELGVNRCMWRKVVIVLESS